ncbi:MAG: AMP-binding protein, partial [Nocardioidaceae bacterium]
MTTGTQARSTDAWAEARSQLDGLPAGRGLNIAHEAVDRHVLHGAGGTTALRLVAVDETVTEVTYADLAGLTAAFANALDTLEVRRGEVVFSLLGRDLDIFVAALGTLKHGSVFCPLFTAFGPEPIRQRLLLGHGRVLVTTAELYRRRVDAIRAGLRDLEHVLLVDAEPGEVPGTLSLRRLLERSAGAYEIPSTDPEEPALLHFTSGTTGTPKGALHVHEAVVAHHSTAATALGLRPTDVFWCTADPGWVTGTSYGIIAPLTHGATVVCDAGEFAAKRWYRILEQQRVTVWYTAPTALRMLMRAGADVVEGFDLSALRHIGSVGEPLNPEVVVWAQETYERPVLDNWWQTETGAIMIGNRPDLPVRPGSMGKPLPGVEATILARDERGSVLVDDCEVCELGPGGTGELALRPGWPSMFRTYLGEQARYQR